MCSSSAPNPFRDSTRFAFELAADTHVTMRVYDLSGRMICDLWDRPADAGPFSLDWNGVDSQGDRVASGVYIVEVEAGDRTERRRVALVR